MIRHPGRRERSDRRSGTQPRKPRSRARWSAGVERAVSRAGHDVDGDPGGRADHGFEPNRGDCDRLRLIAAVRSARLGPGSPRSASAPSGMTEFGICVQLPLPPLRSSSATAFRKMGSAAVLGPRSGPRPSTARNPNQPFPKMIRHPGRRERSDRRSGTQPRKPHRCGLARFPPKWVRFGDEDARQLRNVRAFPGSSEPGKALGALGPCRPRSRRSGRPCSEPN